MANIRGDGPPGRLDAAEGLPLFGRDAEWHRLRETLDHVRAGGFRAVFIEGEAGIGKTRLIEEVARAATADGFAIFSGRAEDLERLRPFGALIDGVVKLATHESETSRLETLLRDPSRSAGPPDVIDAFIEFVEERGVTQPTCVILEDLHWADPDTISAARGMTRRLGYLPILFVGTFRPHPQAPDLLRLIDVSLSEGATHLLLERLGDDAITALAEGLVGTPLGPRLTSMLDACSGNPLFAAEFVRALDEQGSFRRENGTTDATTSELPPSLRLTILRRLSQFSPDVLKTLKIAAVLGSSFNIHELATFSERSAADIAEMLEGPLAARIIRERADRLAFRHDLIHEAIYEDIPAPIRASMHVEASRVLEAADAPKVRVAEHVIRGLDLGDPTLFDDVVSLMADLRLAAPLVALALADKALSVPVASEPRKDVIRRFIIWPLVMTGRRDDARRLAQELLSRPQDLTAAAAIRLPAAMALAEDGRTAEAIAELETLVEDLPSPPQLSRIARITHGGQLMRAGIYDRLDTLEDLLSESQAAQDPFSLTLASGSSTVGLVARGRFVDAVRRAEDYMDMEGAYRSVVPTPLLLTALAYMAADRFTDTEQALEEGNRRAREAGEIPALAVYSAVKSLLAFLAGAWEEAGSEAHLTFELVEHSNGSPVGLLFARVAAAQVALHRASFEEARFHIAEAERYLMDKGPQWAMDIHMWTTALLHEAEGNAGDALKLFVVGWNASRGGHHLFGRSTFGDLVRLALASGDRDLAAEVAAEAAVPMEHSEEIHSVMGSALRCRGLLDGDADALLAAVEAYRKSPRVVEKAAACEDTAYALIRRDKPRDARVFFEEALTVYEDVDATYDVRRLIRAMRDAGLRRGSREKRDRPKTGWGALTATEEQVAHLTVEGLTNPQIAERLFVSKHTVQTHLSHIFGKLGISSRVDLTRIAAGRSAD